MCGICGELTFASGAVVRADVLTSMRERLVHRGPDDEGLFVAGSGRAGLAFRRLKIIDLSAAANQPMSNEDGTMRVAFNGEIYNFRALRDGLEQRGHRFRSSSDTETIVHLYEERGPGFVDALDGMFAIAIWDERNGRLVLARDRAGKKPLFYYHDERRFVFGSEIKALFAHPDVPVRVDETRIPGLFVRGYVRHPETLYRSIRQVDPASTVVVELDGRLVTRSYWRLQYADASAQAKVRRAEARERVRHLVTDAVSKRLVSDVPLGAFLSGGIDSTVVVGLMSGLVSAPVKTFTIGFEGDAAYDETAAARLVAKRFGTEHTEFRVRPSAVDLVDRLIWHHDGPFGDSSAIPTYLVSELTRQHVTVVLTGDGGDEVFAGYLRFVAALAAERLPAALGPLLRAGLGVLTPAPNERHLLARARRFADFMHAPLLERLARWNSVFQDDVTDLMLPEVSSDAPAQETGDGDSSSPRMSPLSRMLSANFSTYLPDDLLVKTDRCTMANSLEARCPFLDTALLEYVAALPDAWKLDGRRTKVLLREAFADLIPPDIDRRPKTGFGVPLDAWFRADLREYVRDTLLAPSARWRTYLRPEAVQRIVDAHLRGAANYGHRLWLLVCFERWLQLLPSWTAVGQPPQQQATRSA
jgi:asparagine synthase (glutamine-hydrolysing)